MAVADVSPKGQDAPVQGGAHRVGHRSAHDGGAHAPSMLVPNSLSGTIMETKLTVLPGRSRGTSMVERTYALEQDIAVAKAEIENFRKGRGK